MDWVSVWRNQLEADGFEHGHLSDEALAPYAEQRRIPSTPYNDKAVRYLRMGMALRKAVTFVRHPVLSLRAKRMATPTHRR